MPKNFDLKKEYEKYISLKDLFSTSSTGLNTEFDKLALQNSKSNAESLLKNLSELDANAIINRYDLKKSKRSKVDNAIEDIRKNNPTVTKIDYRPFDKLYTIYTGASNGLMGRPRGDIMDHMVNKDNVALITMRQYAYNVPEHCYTFITHDIVASRLFISNKGYCTVCPLYLYPGNSNQQTLGKKSKRVPNLDSEIVQKVSEVLNLKFELEKEDTEGTFAPIDLLDYIYAVLHSPTYREKYKEFLKIDFPRVPYPTDPGIFWQLVNLGGELRQIHLLEHPIVNDFITTYPEPGSNEIKNRLTKTDPGFILYTEDDEAPTHTGKDHLYPNERLGKVQINDKQYFGMVPEKAWNFYIRGYQPAEKWLKDRRDRELSTDEIMHYQKIIVALMETDRSMRKIDKIEF